MLFCATTSQAQRKWELSENSVSEILSGDEHAYVLRQGIHELWSSNGYLNSGTDHVVHEVDSTCLYNFIEFGEKVVGAETYKVYVLKNQANGKYLSSGKELYVASKANAFKVTARKAKEKVGANFDNWEDFSCCVNVEKCVGAEAGGAWVLCNAESATRQYISFGDNPGFKRYTDTAHWFIHLATEVEVSPYEKMTMVFDDYFADGVDTDRYPIGDAPGCVSQDLFDALMAAYNEGFAAYQNPNLEPEECDRVRFAIVNVFDRYKKEMIQIGNGYYVIVNGRSMDATYDGGDIARCKLGMEAPEKWSVDNAKYIWEVSTSAETGKITFKNFGTDRYIGLGDPYPMTAEVEKAHGFTAPHTRGLWFRLHDGKMYVHNNVSGKIVTWNSTGSANQWRFNPVSNDTIDSLKVIVAQNQLDKKMATLVKDIKDKMISIKTVSGMTYDATYSSLAKGLVKEMTANCPYPGNKEPLAFDGNITTYFHTMWKADQAPTDDWHWVQMDLGKEISEIYLKFTDRHDRPGNRPTEVAFVAPGEGNTAESPVWTDTIFKGEVKATYPTAFPNGTKDSTTFIGKIAFDKAAQNVRMVVLKTVNSDIRGFGVTWNLSELRVYDAAECVANPRYDLVPQDIKDALFNTIDKAEAEYQAHASTVETYEALEAAIEAFWKAYPNPAVVENALKKAQKMYDIAVEGSELGYFEAGAKDELLKVIEAVKANLENVLTLEDIAANKQKLMEAMKAFNAKIVAPESGKVYRIISGSAPTDDKGNEPAIYSSLVSSLNADINSTPVWRYKSYDGADERFNTLWLVEKSDEGYAFKNLANGFYINNPYEGLTEEEVDDLYVDEVGYSRTPKHFELGSGLEAGIFIAAMTEGQYLNLRPDGDLTSWHNGYSNGSYIQFAEVSESDFSSTYKISARPGEYQILSLPIDLGYTYTNNSAAMKVLGVKDNKIQLAEYAEDEIIPAGTPFIILTEAGNKEEGVDPENFVTAELPSEDLKSQLNLTYNYKPVVQNGLVSSMVRFALEPGYGFLYKNQTYISEGGEFVAAGTGFFNNELPTTDVDGDYTIDLLGNISGESTAVENVELVKNVTTDVYTISGVKVRSNVKAGVATQGLPKGIYIVGDKKVLVK